MQLFDPSQKCGKGAQKNFVPNPPQMAVIQDGVSYVTGGCSAPLGCHVSMVPSGSLTPSIDLSLIHI